MTNFPSPQTASVASQLPIIPVEMVKRTLSRSDYGSPSGANFQSGFNDIGSPSLLSSTTFGTTFSPTGSKFRPIGQEGSATDMTRATNPTKVPLKSLRILDPSNPTATITFTYNPASAKPMTLRMLRRHFQTSGDSPVLPYFTFAYADGTEISQLQEGRVLLSSLDSVEVREAQLHSSLRPSSSGSQSKRIKSVVERELGRSGSLLYSKASRRLLLRRFNPPPLPTAAMTSTRTTPEFDRDKYEFAQSQIAASYKAAVQQNRLLASKELKKILNEAALVIQTKFRVGKARSFVEDVLLRSRAEAVRLGIVRGDLIDGVLSVGGGGGDYGVTLGGSVPPTPTKSNPTTPTSEARPERMKTVRERVMRKTSNVRAETKLSNAVMLFSGGAKIGMIEFRTETEGKDFVDGLEGGTAIDTAVVTSRENAIVTIQSVENNKKFVKVSVSSPKMRTRPCVNVPTKKIVNMDNIVENLYVLFCADESSPTLYYDSASRIRRRVLITFGYRHGKTKYIVSVAVKQNVAVVEAIGQGNDNKKQAVSLPTSDGYGKEILAISSDSKKLQDFVTDHIHFDDSDTLHLDFDKKLKTVRLYNGGKTVGGQKAIVDISRVGTDITVRVYMNGQSQHVTFGLAECNNSKLGMEFCEYICQRIMFDSSGKLQVDFKDSLRLQKVMSAGETLRGMSFIVTMYRLGDAVIAKAICTQVNNKQELELNIEEADWAVSGLGKIQDMTAEDQRSLCRLLCDNLTLDKNGNLKLYRDMLHHKVASKNRVLIDGHSYSAMVTLVNEAPINNSPLLMSANNCKQSLCVVVSDFFYKKKWTIDIMQREWSKWPFLPPTGSGMGSSKQFFNFSSLSEERRTEVCDYILDKLAFDDENNLVLDLHNRWKRNLVLNTEFAFNGVQHSHVTIIDGGGQDGRILVENVGSVTLTEKFKKEALAKTGGEWGPITDHLYMNDDGALILDLYDTFERKLSEKIVRVSSLNPNPNISFRQKGTKIIMSIEDPDSNVNICFVVVDKSSWVNTGYGSLNAHTKSELVEFCEVIAVSAVRTDEDEKKWSKQRINWGNHLEARFNVKYFEVDVCRNVIALCGREEVERKRFAADQAAEAAKQKKARDEEERRRVEEEARRKKLEFEDHLAAVERKREMEKELKERERARVERELEEKEAKKKRELEEELVAVEKRKVMEQELKEVAAKKLADAENVRLKKQKMDETMAKRRKQSVESGKQMRSSTVGTKEKRKKSAANKTGGVGTSGKMTIAKKERSDKTGGVGTSGKMTIAKKERSDDEDLAAMKIQRMIVSFMVYRKWFSLKLNLAAGSGVMMAVGGTAQGETGFYLNPKNSKVYYYDVDSIEQKWVSNRIGMKHKDFKQIIRIVRHEGGRGTKISDERMLMLRNKLEIMKDVERSVTGSVAGSVSTSTRDA